MLSRRKIQDSKNLLFSVICEIGHTAFFTVTFNYNENICIPERKKIIEVHLVLTTQTLKPEPLYVNLSFAV